MSGALPIVLTPQTGAESHGSQTRPQMHLAVGIENPRSTQSTDSSLLRKKFLTRFL